MSATDRPQAPRKVLLLTVGTGDTSRIEETLLGPLRRSIAEGSWWKVVLLPSQETKDYARALSEEITEPPVEVRPLAKPDMENNADDCYAHFDRLISELRAEGIRPEAMVVDFTRGTKVMSAALVLCAVRHELLDMRYIHGNRDTRGSVKPGSERLLHIKTTVATGRRRIETAYGFFKRGNFAAALDVLPDPSNPFRDLWPEDLLEFAAYVRPMAAFYAAWDRLDYRTAAAVELDPKLARPSEWDALYPSQEMRKWVAALAVPVAETSGPRDAPAMATRLRRLVPDLLANGERRIRDFQFEDAVLRAYRILEMIGQARLFEHGLDSASLPADHPAVRRLVEDIAKKKRGVQLNLNKDGTLMASREKVARLLKRLGDSFGQELVNFAKDAALLQPTARNNSILIHGFEAVGLEDAKPLKDLYARLEGLLIQDTGESARANLAIARSIDFSES